MAIYKLQEMPDMQNKGKKRVYPKLVVNRQLNTKEFIEKMHFRNRAISPSVTTAVLTDIADYLGEMLSMGYTVKLDGLGTFSLSLDFDDEKTKELTSDDDKMLYRKVKVKDVNFKSDSELVKYVNQEIDLEREPGGVTRLYKKKYTLEERIQRGKDWIKEHVFFTLQGTQEVDHRSRCSLRLHRQRKPQDLDR
nr:hypothetical protein [uncultured Prevotella sp.]